MVLLYFDLIIVYRHASTVEAYQVPAISWGSSLELYSISKSPENVFEGKGTLNEDNEQYHALRGFLSKNVETANDIGKSLHVVAPVSCTAIPIYHTLVPGTGISYLLYTECQSVCEYRFLLDSNINRKRDQSDTRTLCRTAPTFLWKITWI